MVIVDLQTSIFIGNSSLAMCRAALDGIYSSSFHPRPYVNFWVLCVKTVHGELVNFVITCGKDDVLMIPVEEVCVEVVSPVWYVSFLEGFSADFSLLFVELLFPFEGSSQKGAEGFGVIWKVVWKVVFEVGSTWRWRAEFPV